MISKAYKLTQELLRYERDQESYEREKLFQIEQYRSLALTKLDRSGISEDERRKRMMEIMKAEWESQENNG